MLTYTCVPVGMLESNSYILRDEASGALALDTVMEALEKKLPAHRRNLLPMNRQALERGMALVK